MSHLLAVAMLVLFATLPLALSASFVPACVRVPVCVRMTLRMTAEQPADADAWQNVEDWALLDGVLAFTVGRDDQVATFWSALASSTPQLAARGAAACEQRWASIAPSEAPKVGRQPEVLENWSRLADGRISGRLAGQPSTVWLTVVMEGRLEGDPRERAGYVEALGGRIYELGEPATPDAAAFTAVTSAVAPRADAPSSTIAQQSSAITDALSMRLPYAAAGVLLAGAIGFVAGTGMAPPPPPPVQKVTRVFIAPGASVPKSAGLPESQAGSSGGQQQQQQAKAQIAKAPLTIKEQRERAALRVDRDKAKLQMIQQRIREDEQSLTEIERVEAQRGGDSEAVKLIFPRD